VRGLDSDTSTTFEFAADALDGAQNAIGGGGRYDGLVEQMGGKPTPGIGFGIGIERVLIACAAEDVTPGDPPHADVFVVDGLDNPTEVTLLVTELREDGLRAERAYGGRSFKAQMKVADRAGARYTILLGAREAEHGAVGVRDMQTHEQIEVPRDLVAGWVQERLETPSPREVDDKR
jgi:histidyl-tRNA synthetase